MTGPAVPAPNPQADLWDALVKAGLSPDSATASVHKATAAGVSNADAWDHFVLNKPLPSSGTPGVDPTRPAQTLFDHISDIVTGGQGKKALAAVQSLAAGHGLTDYTSNLAKTNYDLKAEHDANPKTALAGDVVGGVISPLNKLVAPLGLLGGGAALGALQGSGAAKDDLGSQVLGTGAGAIGGGLTAGLLGGVMKMFGPSAGEQMVARAAADPRVKATLTDLVNSGRGDEAVLADLSPKLNGQLNRSANRSPDVMEMARKVVDGRQPDAAGRVMNDFTDAAGSPHAAALADQMKAARLAWADGPSGFQGLRDKFTSLPVGRDLTAVLQRPGMKDALEQVKLADKLSGSDVSTQIQKSLGSGGLGLTAMTPNPNQQVSYTAAAQLERRLDGMAGKAGSDVALANAYKTLRNGVGDFLAETVPEHAAVKAQYHQMLNGEEALTAGAKAWSNPSARDVAREFANLAPADQALYRKGAASSVIDELGDRKTNLNAASRITDASGATKAKLQMIFGDEPTFDKFMQNAQAERTLSRLNHVVGGSETAMRMQDDGTQATGALMRGASSLAHGRGVVSSLLHIAAPTMMNAMRNQTALDAGPLLTTQGSDAITQLLTKMQGPQQTIGLLTQGALGGSNVSGSVAGGLLGQ